MIRIAQRLIDRAREWLDLLGPLSRATIDFESRSACPIKLGAEAYSKHPSTELMVLCVRLPYWGVVGDRGPEYPVRTWHPAYPHLGIEEVGVDVLEELFAWIIAGGLVEAHNAGFEQAMWRNVGVARHGWPSVPVRQWRCSAAKCAAMCLPRSLDGAAKALKLDQKKDLVGNAVMKKISKPRKMRKAELEQYMQAWEAGEGPHPDDVILWRESVEEFEILWRYCAKDVLTEEAISHALPDLPESEQVIWFMDQEMNQRGVRVDVLMAKGAIKIAEQYKAALNRELNDLTGIEAGTKREDIRRWLRDHGIDLPNTAAETVDEWLGKTGLTPDQKRVLYILREVNRSSTAKYGTGLAQADPIDWRARDQLMYHGAGTGRWTGKGMQVHNFKKGYGDDLSMGNACDIIASGDMRYLIAMYGENAMEVLADAIRGLLIPDEGREFIVADFAAIEARVVLWLARQMSALRVFEEGKDIYMDMASGIYGYPVTDKKKQKDERQFGKQAILGLGFEMGFVTFLATCMKYNIRFDAAMCKRIVGDGWDEQVEKIRKYFEGDRRRVAKLEGMDREINEAMPELALMRHTVMVYRERYPEVTGMWRDQEKAAIAAVRTPGRVVECERGRNVWFVEGNFLKTRLPSGRCLHYPEPKILSKAVPWNKQEKRPNLTFMEEYNKSWVRTSAYGGLLVENITQATARDLMAEAMVRADQDSKYDVIMSVHDELVCEIDKGLGNVREFEQMMAMTPAWAAGCPVEAEGWRGPRYRK